MLTKYKEALARVQNSKTFTPYKGDSFISEILLVERPKTSYSVSTKNINKVGDLLSSFYLVNGILFYEFKDYYVLDKIRKRVAEATLKGAVEVNGRTMFPMKTRAQRNAVNKLREGLEIVSLAGEYSIESFAIDKRYYKKAYKMYVDVEYCD